MAVGLDPNRHALDPTQKALAELDSPSVGVSSIARLTLRVARLRHDYAAVLRLEHELHDNDDSDWYGAILAEALQHVPRGWLEARRLQVLAGYQSGRTIKIRRIRAGQEDDGVGWGLPQIEWIILQHRQDLAQVNIKMTMDATVARNALRNQQDEINLSIFELETILERVKQWLYTYLTTTEQQLMFTQIIADIFAKYRTYVDNRLSLIAPGILGQLNIAYVRANENNSETFSQAALACRRVLKALADIVYPARTEPIIGADGKEHLLNDERFVARLWQFVHESLGKSKAGILLNATLDDIGKRLDALYDLASKGVHADVSAEEADQCVIQTYLLVGDILRLHEQTAD